MARNTLTARRQAILDYIVQHSQAHGYPPTVREIGKEVGLTSSSSVHFHLQALEKAGLIQRDGSLTRALRPMGGPAVPVTRAIPLIGKVAAGAPILAVENVEETLPLPEQLVPGGEVFALRVQGDSMVNAGILDGDLVLVQRQQTAANGEIVVALLEDEATVKRYYQHGDQVELRPENDRLQPIFTREAQIIGKVCGVLRTY